MSESNQKKVIVIGDGAVGKTCFVSKVTENKFIPNYLPTLGGKKRMIYARKLLEKPTRAGVE